MRPIHRLPAVLISLGALCLWAGAGNSAVRPASSDESSDVSLSWTIETVVSGRSSDTSLALDGAGNPNIGYYDIDAGGELKVALWNGSRWQTATVDSEGNVGWGVSFAIDPAGNRHMSYYDVVNNSLKYAASGPLPASIWRTTTVDKNGRVGTDSSLALDSRQDPHIAYYDLGASTLRYIHQIDGQWQAPVQVGTDLNVGGDASLALDRGNNPHVVYRAGCVRCTGWPSYARWVEGAWQTEVIEEPVDAGWYASLALDADDIPHVSYFDSANQDLKYAKKVGNSWQVQTVDDVGHVGTYTSLALDGDGLPHISYHDVTLGALKYAHFTGDHWRIETVDDEGRSGQYSSLVLDADDNPRISYYDSQNAVLKYAASRPSPPQLTITMPNGCEQPYEVGTRVDITFEANVADTVHLWRFPERRFLGEQIVEPNKRYSIQDTVSEPTGERWYQARLLSYDVFGECRFTVVTPPTATAIRTPTMGTPQPITETRTPTPNDLTAVAGTLTAQVPTATNTRTPTATPEQPTRVVLTLTARVPTPTPKPPSLYLPILKQAAE